MKEYFLYMVNKEKNAGRISEYAMVVEAAEKIPKFKHAWEFAMLHLDGEHFGKEFMLGTNWYAKKILDKESKGYQIGKAYFAEKRKEKNIS